MGGRLLRPQALQVELVQARLLVQWPGEGVELGGRGDVGQGEYWGVVLGGGNCVYGEAMAVAAWEKRERERCENVAEVKGNWVLPCCSADEDV